ncbi:MAG: hypothetical protein GWP07_07990 [Xanthomonadaceae bacterium]|nr:hypothetical protein [Xanthomonadaceae bacterium]
MAMEMNDADRFSYYRGLCRQMNDFFGQHIAAYCHNCQQVLRRLPDGSDQHELVSGVFPGCCHRGAGDVFRLEGVGGEPRLSAGIIALLQKARSDKMDKVANYNSLYELRNCHTGERITGEHCRYFGACGCRLDDLKGPLCINFICPPIRSDLLKVTGHDEVLVGPEHDFLGIYQVLSVIGTGSIDEVNSSLVDFSGRLETLNCSCEKYISSDSVDSLFDAFCIIDDDGQEPYSTGECAI